MKNARDILILLALVTVFLNCANRGLSLDSSRSGNANARKASATPAPVPPPSEPAPPTPANTSRVIHVLVALCDNVNQGIVPVPPRLGNGEDLQNNLYWGAAYGVKAFFNKSKDWQLLAQHLNVNASVLERCVFKHRTTGAMLVADAYRGAHIQQTIGTFFDYAAGNRRESLQEANLSFGGGGDADLIVYVGHNGLMDFALPSYPTKRDEKRRDTIMLCCASRNYFSSPLRQTGAMPLLWTTNLMAPEAYILKTAIDGWLLNESGERIRARAAGAYNTYQRCGLRAAQNLFASGW